MRILRCLLVVLAMGLGSAVFGPVKALARHSMSFSPGTHARPRVSRAGRHAHVARHGRSGRGRSGHAVRSRRHAPERVTRRSRADDEGGDAAKAVPGKGFTLENGILTYPAPARFQPKNLPRR